LFSLKQIYRIFPSFLITKTLQNIAIRDLGFEDIPRGASPWHWDISGYNITLMACEAIGYLGLTIILEYLSSIPRVLAFSGMHSNTPVEVENLDSDVAAEQERIRAMIRPDGSVDCKDPVILSGLRKVYNSQSTISALFGSRPFPWQMTVAVKDMYCTVPRGQVFGFLGANGAGMLLHTVAVRSTPVVCCFREDKYSGNVMW